MRVLRATSVLIAASLLCAAAGGAARPQEPDWEELTPRAPFSITISAEADVFIVGSPMLINVVLINTSFHPIRLLKLNWCNYTAEIRDSQGTLVRAKPLAERLPDGGVRLRHRATDTEWVHLDPGKTANNICTEYNLTDDYELTKPGKYTVQLLRYDYGTKRWVRSNTISIAVLPKQAAQVTVGVWDPSGATIPRAKVEYKRSAGQVFHYVCADNEGRATLGLEPGKYDLRMSSPGFRTLTKRLEVSDGEIQTVKIVLRLGGCPECPLVISLAPVFQVTDESPLVVDTYNERVRFEKMLRYYKGAVRAHPSNAGLHNSLGIAYAKLGQYQQARAEFKKAAELDPAGATHAYFNLGSVSVSFPPAFDEAVADFRKAIELDPANAEAHEWLGIELMRRANIVKDGRQVAPPEAVRAFETYLKLKPEGMYAQWDAQIIKQGLPFNPPNPCAR